MKSRYNLFHNIKEDAGWLIQMDAASGQRDLLYQARSWANVLPDKKYMVLLAEGRRNFITGFVAAQIKRQTVLMPSNRSVGAIKEVLSNYPDSYCLIDGALALENALLIDCHDFQVVEQTGTINEEVMDPEHIAVIAFTSGSTGVAQPNPKTWGSLVHGAHLAKQRFGFDPQHSIVATVPPQHMYGLETTVMVPLIVGSRIFSGRTFYPEDIRLALEKCSGKRVLVTTPIHLRACVAAELSWPELDMIISATAPLDDNLLQQAAEIFNAPVLEIYGCTEAGSLASRDLIKDKAWKLYDDFEIYNRDGNTVVSAKHLPEEVVLADMVELAGDNSFLLLGRHADMVNIAGKRASLGDLNMKLNAINGVKDGVFIMPDSNKKLIARLTALVVAPGIDEAQILAALSDQIDSVFLPRPLYKVDALPRNETGKLTRQSLLVLLGKIESAA